ncbi:Paraquat-inducible protein A [Citrobacter freundii]|uniref:Paraquat-inducible protein A n=1 Tax=Citrobacter freundii TaxID=546 RepID=A0A7G2ISU1_CITFR|nr:Paraquat-inducible protein A [Citrobacter freundii]
MRSHQSAFCPRCQAKIRDGRDWSLTRLAAMAFTMLLLMPFAWGEPLLHIYLLGVRIDANVMQGIWQMTRQGDPLTASFVLFCVAGAPLILVTSIAYLWFGNILGMNLRPVLLMLERLKEWVMLDIYLVGIGVASIKVQDYAFLQPGVGLFAFIALVILSILTLSHLNVEQLWDRFYPQRPARRPDEKAPRLPRLSLYRLSGRSGSLPSLPYPAALAQESKHPKVLGGATGLDCPTFAC